MSQIKIDKNLSVLKYLESKASGDVKDKIRNIAFSYKHGEIPMFSQALKVAEVLSSKHKATIESGRGQKLYDELHDKYYGALPRKDKRTKSYIISKFDVMYLDTPLVRLVFNLYTDLIYFKQMYRLINSRVESEVKKIFQIKKSMKIKFILNFDICKKEVDENGKMSETIHNMTYSTAFVEVSKGGNDINKIILNRSVDLSNKLDILINSKGSGWGIKKFYWFHVQCATIKAVRGASFIPTPEPYNNPKCGLINIQNDDDKCFYWCTKYHHAGSIKHGERTSLLRKIPDKYNYVNVNYPSSHDDIKMFENNNKICVFVYYIDDENKIRPEYQGNMEFITNDILYLLRIGNDDKSHYVYIKHIERFLNIHTHVVDKDKRFCPVCNGKVNVCDYSTHIRECYKFACSGSLLKLPPVGSKMKFRNFKNKMERPYIVYADMESTLVKYDDRNKTDTTEKTHHHVVNSCCFYFVCTFDHSKNKLWWSCEPDCVEQMMIELYTLSEKCIVEMRQNQEMEISKKEMTEFFKAKTCSICDCEFKPKDIRVRDHDHRTGKFRGAAHQKCNINYFNNRYLPVVFHNLKGYDGHMIIKKAHDISNKLSEIHNADAVKSEINIKIVPNSYEKFMSFEIGSLKFIDSFQFMASSLETLVENLYMSTPDDEFNNFKLFDKQNNKIFYPYEFVDNVDKYVNFKFMNKYFGDNISALCRKGFYPYEWVDNVDKLNNVGLPDRVMFYSSLSQKHISHENYEHATNVYKSLNCKSFKDYHLIYLKCDVLQLADVFENFRQTCLEYYNLDPANYISAPGLAWDAMLNQTKIELDLITDPKILDIIERQKKGGLCFVGSQRHTVANNHYLENFDKTKPENYIIYLDANNEYGWAMSKPLPYKNLKLYDEPELFESLMPDILECPDDSSIGFIIECDLIFPPHIHDKLKEFPPCPENICPKTEWLSEFQKGLLKSNGMKACKNSKLIPHLMEHKNYCIHYTNLKFVVGLGVEIGKVHNIISFNQKPWLKQYIDFNTEKRKKAKNDFEKDFFKLMNNAVFGKTMENVKNRIDLHLTTDHDNAIKWFSKINLKDCKSYDGLYLIEMYKKEIVYDKPIYVGTSILDISKLCLLDFHYNVIVKEFKDNYNLLYSDTDSLVYNIKTPDVYDWMSKNKNYLDLSDCVRPELKDNTNKKVLGKMKDELNGLIITEFTALNPKVYSFNHQSIDEFEKISIHNKKTLKGVSKVVVKNEITHDDYVQVLQTNVPIYRNITSIRSFKHQVFTMVQKKKALTSYYDKMKMIDYNTCVPFGFIKS